MSAVQSMTGFGRAERDLGEQHVCVEVRSVNHRYLELNLNLPQTLAFYEPALRSRIQKRVCRGRLDVWVSVDQRDSQPWQATVNQALLTDLRDRLDEVRLKERIPGEVSIDLLARYPEVVTIEAASEAADEALGESVTQILDLALDALGQMRESEGSALRQEIVQRLDVLERAVEQAARSAEGLPAAAYKKLEERVAQLLGEPVVDSERLHQELALLADKMDVREEVVRLRTHLVATREMLEAGGELGKKLDFLLQELGREANTLGSKARDPEVTGHVVAMKAEIEKIREQGRNLQ